MYINYRHLDRVLNLIHRLDIERINSHLPAEYKTLREIVSSNPPSVKARDGSDIIIDREDLNFLSEVLPSDLHEKLRLPLVFVRRMDLGVGIYELVGGVVEAYTVLRIMGENISIDKVSLPLRIYKPHMFKLKMAIPSCVIISFGEGFSSSTEDDVRL
ncbi:MAG: DUF61 family protein [archaeon GBS-70-058]|nr:DUF61 family protein [Candidatus Culexarchaeum nevadense]